MFSVLKRNFLMRGSRVLEVISFARCIGGGLIDQLYIMVNIFLIFHSINLLYQFLIDGGYRI